MLLLMLLFTLKGKVVEYCWNAKDDGSMELDESKLDVRGEGMEEVGLEDEFEDEYPPVPLIVKVFKSEILSPLPFI